MEPMKCPGCGAFLSIDTGERVLVCEYCDTTSPNPYYEDDGMVYLDDFCVEMLVQRAEGVTIEGVRFGAPVADGQLIGAVRAAFRVPEDQQIYMVCPTADDRGFALCTDGVYCCDHSGEYAHHSWQQFVDGDVSYSGEELVICGSAFCMGEYADEIGDFLIAFNEDAYFTWNEIDPAQVQAEPEQTVEALSVDALTRMGSDENLDADCFGAPMAATFRVGNARSAMGIPQEEKVYLLHYQANLLGGCREGFALADGGLYYKHDGSEGKRSWEAFVTGSIACAVTAAQATLSMGTSLSFAMAGDEQIRLARFLVDFHNYVYQQYTGSAAPDSWTVRERAAASYLPASSTPVQSVATMGSLLSSLFAPTTVGRERPPRPAAHSQHGRPLFGARPQASRPQAGKPQATWPQVGRPQTSAKPQAAKPQAVRPQDSKPQSARPQAARPQAVRPQDSKPQTGRPQAINPQTAKPQTIRPQDSKPQAAKPQGVRPHAAKPQPGRPSAGRAPGGRPGGRGTGRGGR